MEFITDPQAIEQKSMKIIKEELGELDCSVKEEKVIKRVVHATANPDLADAVIISKEAIKSAGQALQSGANVITDVNMLRSGISKRKINELGCNVECFISDEDVAKRAKKAEITRSMMSMRYAAESEENKIFVIGNAPTALFELIKLIRTGKVKPELVIGTPVGFVGAKEAKLELEKIDLPYITLRGRKGGSAVAASIINALLYMN